MLMQNAKVMGVKAQAKFGEAHLMSKRLGDTPRFETLLPKNDMSGGGAPSHGALPHRPDGRSRHGMSLSAEAAPCANTTAKTAMTACAPRETAMVLSWKGQNGEQERQSQNCCPAHHTCSYR